jgi:hypothetical protein
MITFWFGLRNERQESLAKNMTFSRCFMLHGYGTHWRFFIFGDKGMAFFGNGVFFLSCVSICWQSAVQRLGF